MRATNILLSKPVTTNRRFAATEGAEHQLLPDDIRLDGSGEHRAQEGDL